MDYTLTQHLDLGIGFSSLGFDFEASDSNLRGEVEHAYRGFMVYFTTKL